MADHQNCNLAEAVDYHGLRLDHLENKYGDTVKKLGFRSRFAVVRLRATTGDAFYNHFAHPLNGLSSIQPLNAS